MRSAILTGMLVAGAFSAALAPIEHIAAQQNGADFRLETLAEGLDHPWSLAFLPNGDMLVTERTGYLRVVRNGRLDPEPVAGVPRVATRGQGGLLDVAVDPGFAENRFIYLSYAGADGRSAGTEVVRARFNGDSLSDVQSIFRAEPKTRGGRHFGSRLVIDRDGYLFISLGDRGDHMKEAQNTGSHLGSIIRINRDGTVPQDNPFVGQDGARPEIWSYGHRNVQGMTMHPETGAIWAHEHGPRGGDEVNIIRRGANYGWPAITYGIDYSGAIISDKTSAPGMEQPVVYWVPSIAPSGMAFYDGMAFPQWRGDLFVGALAGRHLRRLEMDGDRVTAQEVLLDDLAERIRDVRSGPDGSLYLLTDSPRGRVLRLAPAG
ncbi:MAG TPA: PQQ-dependent sugar dehydrogenase [Afifellaceae bacterium]|nr:PQQ-dependent sugar dehydrogenase [Afifellaceae bacterium]